MLMTVVLKLKPLLSVWSAAAVLGTRQRTQSEMKPLDLSQSQRERAQSAPNNDVEQCASRPGSGRTTPGRGWLWEAGQQVHTYMLASANGRRSQRYLYAEWCSPVLAQH